MNDPLPLVGRLSPFTVLGIPATLDLGRVKRAWFAALARHPPHKDPEGFRRLRAAYEALIHPGGLVMAFAASPIDATATLATWNERFEVSIARRIEEDRRSQTESGAIRRFVDATSRLTFFEALAVHRPPDPPSRS